MVRLWLVTLAGLLFVLSPVTFAQNTASDTSQQPQQNTQVPSSRPEDANPNSLPESPSETKKKQKSEQELEIERREQSQKILGVVPQYSVTSRHNAPPLTADQKFHLMLKSTVNPFEFVATGLQAGLSQAEDEFPAYGQGAEGFGKRYGAAYADQATSNFFSNYAYPVLFKEDPRYFRLGEGSIPHRILYSLEQEFEAVRDTDHRREFNLSNVLGAFTSGAISNAYYPQADRGFGNTMSRSAIALTYGSVGGLVDEFWPDIHDRWSKKKKKADAQ